MFVVKVRQDFPWAANTQEINHKWLTMQASIEMTVMWGYDHFVMLAAPNFVQIFILGEKRVWASFSKRKHFWCLKKKSDILALTARALPKVSRPLSGVWRKELSQTAALAPSPAEGEGMLSHGLGIAGVIRTPKIATRIQPCSVLGSAL